MKRREYCVVCSSKINNHKNRYCSKPCAKIARRILSYNSIIKIGRQKIKINKKQKIMTTVKKATKKVVKKAVKKVIKKKK